MIFWIFGWICAFSSLMHIYHCVQSEEVVLDLLLCLNLIGCAGTALFMVSNVRGRGHIAVL